MIDTAGRLQIDEELMDELARLKAVVKPHHIVFVADAMTGQEAANVARGLPRAAGLSGVILTKLDSDARGGAALSVRAVTGAPILFVGLGEKARFLRGLSSGPPCVTHSRDGRRADADRKGADRITTQTKAKELERKFKKNEFTITDFGEQMKAIRKMGSLGDLIGMIPGLKKVAGAADSEEAKRELKRIQAIIDSMTHQERENHLILNGKRRARIATGSGTTVQDINRFLKQFDQTRKMMKKLTKLGAGKSMMRGLGFGS